MNTEVDNTISFRDIPIEERREAIDKLRGRPRRNTRLTEEEKVEAGRLASLKYYYQNKEKIAAKAKARREAKRAEKNTKILEGGYIMTEFKVY